ncbi:MAG: DUF4129 domain-containing protein [Halanaeroarchaeum sp.]
MDRNVRPLVLAVLALLLVGLAAATVADPVERQPGVGSGSSGILGGPHGASGTAGQSGSLVGPSMGGAPLAMQPICVPFLRTPTFFLSAGLVVLVAGALVYRRGGLLLLTGMGGMVAIPLFLAYLLLTDCGAPSPERTRSGILDLAGNGTFIGGTAASGGGGTAVPTSAPLALLGVAALVVGVGLVALRSTGHDDPPTEPSRDPTPESTADLEALGSTAGDAADRVESADTVDNEVFRAWRDLTDHLDVDTPAASTPAEFAAAAEAAGMDPDLVGDLTEVFRSVRYGGKAPTDERERRAVAALRAIEAAYAPEDDDAAP